MKNKLLLTLLTATCLFSSCTKENEVNMPQDKSEGNKVTFIVNTAPVTRTTVNTTNNSTQFVENDKIGIFELSTSITDANNYEYKVLSDGTLEAADASKTLYYPNDANENINFYAYYPFNPEAAATDKVEFTVADDQSSEALYNANDFMAATTSENKTNLADGVLLTFSHKLALVQLTLIGDDASKVTAVTLNNCKPTTTWTFSGNVIEAASGTAQDIKMWKITADANTYWALVPAQTITTGTVLFTMTAGETTYTYKPLASDIVFTDNKIKKFNIQLGTNGNTIAVSTDMDTTGWDDTESATSGNGEAVVPKPVDLLGGNGDISKMAAAALTTTTSWLTGITNNTWGATTSAKVWSTDSKAEITNDATKGNVIHLNYSYLNGVTSGWAWHNSTAIYHCVNSAATGEIYELSFDAKIGGDATKQILVFLGFSNNGTNTFFTIEDGSTTYARRYINMSTDWKTYKLTVNFTKVSTNTGSAAITETSDTPSSNWSDFNIGFNAKEVGLDYYITNISLIKKVVTE